MEHSKFAHCVCQACAAQVRHLDRQSAALWETFTSSVTRVSIDVLLDMVDRIDALNRARHHILHACSH